MSKHLSNTWPVDHPEIVAIAVDLMLNPARRAYYSARVLTLADAALEKISLQLSKSARSGNDPTHPHTQSDAHSEKSDVGMDCERCGGSGGKVCDLGYFESPI
jgi:hypothetical protein